MKSSVRLIVLSGPEDGREMTVTLPAVFGRLPDCDVPLPYDWLASRRHARLDQSELGYSIEDLGSRNGTFLLTGEPVQKARAITSGDLFRVGSIWFRLVGALEPPKLAAEATRSGKA